MRFLLAFLLVSFAFTAKAQIGIGTNAPHASAALEIKDTTKGILIPRMKLAQRTAIANPADGLMVYQTDNTKGYWYFDGTQWKSITGGGGSSSNGGKAIITLTDTITNVQAQSKIAAEYGPNTIEILVFDCTNLTSLDLSSITTTFYISISSCPLLQNINLSSLTSIEGEGLDINDCPQLTTLNLSALQLLLTGEGGLSINRTKISTLTLSALKKAKGSLYIYDNPNLTAISFPLLSQSIGRVDIIDNNLLTTISMPLVTSIKTVTISGNNALGTLSFPALTAITDSTFYNNSISNNANLTSIAFNNLSTFKSAGFDASGNKLPSVKINYLLNKFVSITPALTSRYFYFQDQNPLAPPTGQGITDAATLISNGNSVTTD
ncbi:MAG: hypothetical protein V4556_01460 [Bacteroidota bacterium]